METRRYVRCSAFVESLEVYEVRSRSMSVITIFHGSFCSEESVVDELLQTVGYRRILETDVVSEASRISGMPEDKIEGAFSSKTSIFNKFTHEKERATAYLKLALAEMLRGDGWILTGFSGLLIPSTISHVLRVCIIADLKHRIDEAVDLRGLPRKEAAGLISRQDQDRAAWVERLFKTADPWDNSLFDIVIPTGKASPGDAADLIRENLLKDVVKPTEDSRRAVEDFHLAARVETVLAKEGHSVEVGAGSGKVTLTINKHVLMLSRLEEELRSIVQGVDGVKSLETRVGKDFHKADVYRKIDFSIPSKVLLVDDEREFVQTLSERLLMREMGSAVAYDGESALEMIHDDEPDVIILDLKMPGIDGIEVLKRVKKTNPEVEVIILTGHGSEDVRKTCMELGAFAYLRKPVDIDVLSDKLREANAKIRKKQKKQKND
jgi:CheY-like chemotaxis protein